MKLRLGTKAEKPFGARSLSHAKAESQGPNMMACSPPHSHAYAGGWMRVSFARGDGGGGLIRVEGAAMELRYPFVDSGISSTAKSELTDRAGSASRERSGGDHGGRWEGEE